MTLWFGLCVQRNLPDGDYSPLSTTRCPIDRCASGQNDLACYSSLDENPVSLSSIDFTAMRCSFIHPLLALLLVSFATLRASAADAPPENRPFIERVRPDDYFAAEKLFNESFSRTHELVVLRTAAGEPVSVLAIKSAPGGEGYTLTIQIASDSAPDGWLKIREELDAILGQQVLRAFELKLHRQVSISAFKRRVSKTDTDLWVFQRLAQNRVAAARIATEATIGNPSASEFIDGFLASLQEMIGKVGEERAAHLQKIDRLASAIILSESP